MRRKQITKKIRFEVFKRDKFTCQYCGRKAPEVELEIDHIKPVSKGGKNDLLNLVTSCYDCNRGKRDKCLDDDSTIQKQRNELERLQERRNQLEMLVEWQKELDRYEEDEIDYVMCCIDFLDSEQIYEYRERFRKLIKKFGVEEVYKSTRIALDTYFINNGEEMALSMIPRILETRKKNKEDPTLLFKNRAKLYAKKKYKTISDDFIELCEEYVTNEDILNFFISVMRMYSDLDDVIQELDMTFFQWDMEILEKSKEQENGHKKSS